MCTAVLIGWDPATHGRGALLVSQNRRHLFVTPSLKSNGVFTTTLAFRSFTRNAFLQIYRKWPHVRRHESLESRVPGLAFLALRSSWRMVVYIYYVREAGNSISSQLGSSCEGNRYCTEKAGGTAGGPPWWASPLAFGLIGEHCRCQHCTKIFLPWQLTILYDATKKAMFLSYSSTDSPVRAILKSNYMWISLQPPFCIFRCH